MRLRRGASARPTESAGDTCARHFKRNDHTAERLLFRRKGAFLRQSEEKECISSTTMNEANRSNDELEPLSKDAHDYPPIQILKKSVDNNKNGITGEESFPVSKLRKNVSQLCAVSASSLLTLTYGMSVGFSTILIAELGKEDSEIPVNVSELTWISSINYFSIPLGALASGVVSQVLGRRGALRFATLPYIASWLLFRYWANGFWSILSAFTLLGTTGGIIESPIQVYATESSETKMRGSMSASISLTVSLGIFLQVLGAEHLSWRTLATVNASLPALALAVLVVVPETPYWLAARGRHEEAQRALCWLRGWTRPSLVHSEYQTILKSVELAAQVKGTSPHTCRNYFRRGVLVPFGIVTFAFFLATFNGNVSILSYSVMLFRRFESPINEYTSSTILTGLQVFSSFLLVLAVKRYGKKCMSLGTLLVAGAACVLIAVHEGLTEGGIIDRASSHRWLSSVGLIVVTFASALGIRSTPWIMVSEMFPVDVRGPAVGITGSTCNIYSALASKLFLFMIDLFTLPGTFILFAGINFAGWAILRRILPDFEGFSLVEIEEYFDAGSKRKDVEMVPMGAPDEQRKFHDVD